MANNFERLYSFDYNEDRAIRILEKFDIEKYQFVTKNGRTSLIITINLNIYWIEMSDRCDEMIVYKKRIRNRGTKSQKEYIDEIARFKNDAVYNSIKLVVRDNNL